MTLLRGLRVLRVVWARSCNDFTLVDFPSNFTNRKAFDALPGTSV